MARANLLNFLSRTDILFTDTVVLCTGRPVNNAPACLSNRSSPISNFNICLRAAGTHYAAPLMDEQRRRYLLSAQKKMLCDILMREEVGAGRPAPGGRRAPPSRNRGVMERSGN